MHTETGNRLYAKTHSMQTGQSTVKRLQKTLQFYEGQLQAIQQEIKATVEKDALLKDKINKITSIKGVGLLTAVTIIAETTVSPFSPAKSKSPATPTMMWWRTNRAKKTGKPKSLNRATATSGAFFICRLCMRL